MHSVACATAGREAGLRPRWELADVFRRHGAEFRDTHLLSAPQRRVMRDIESCRTALLGGHKERCTSCGFERPSYDSCGNRHCPKCQTFAKEKWLAARQAELLPVPYFHAVFTLPHETNPLVLANPTRLLELLFHAASETLLSFGHNELGGRIGFLVLLHTWDQLLRDHFHLHCLIPGGALPADGSRWIPSPPRFLFRVEPLAQVFRGKFLQGLRSHYNQGKLAFPQNSPELGTPAGFSHLLDSLYGKPWVIYCKPPFAGPEKVLAYLARYTHRVAISNHRLLDVSNDSVRFTYRDRAAGDIVKKIRLPIVEFLRRFLLHVLPNGFQRVRHYGFLSNRAKKVALARCRELLAVRSPAASSEPRAPRNAADAVLALTHVDVHRCPACGKATLFRAETLAPVRATSPSPTRNRSPP